MKKIVLFDFDGTLSADDANIAFWKYCFRRSPRPWLFLPAILAGFVVYGLAILTGGGRRATRLGLLWRELVRLFLTPAMIKRILPDFIRQHERNRFGWAAEQIAKERAAGNFVVLTTGSPAYLVMRLLDGMEFDLIICSQVDPARPWKFRFFNYGENKVKALRAVLGIRPNIIRAYSDSKSDLPMMKLAKEQVWINPETGCREN